MGRCGPVPRRQYLDCLIAQGSLPQSQPQQAWRMATRRLVNDRCNAETQPVSFVKLLLQLQHNAASVLREKAGKQSSLSVRV